jgi:hypothetical protein
MLDFAEIKRIKLTDVAGRYGIRLRYRGDWASAPCPLPTHKAGDKGRNFTINLAQNYWRCFSESCNEKNGGKKGGDCINFVALMENCRERDAAQNLSDWYGLNGATPCKSIHPEGKAIQKTAQRMAERSSQEVENPSQKDFSEPSTPAIAVKGYIGSLDAWFDELFGIGPELRDDEFWKKCRNAVKAKCIESFRNGKLAART